MIRGSEGDLYVKGFHNFAVEVGYKSIPVVGNCRFANTKPRYPLHERLAALRGRRRRHRVGFEPPGGPVQDGEEIFGPL